MWHVGRWNAPSYLHGNDSMLKRPSQTLSKKLAYGFFEVALIFLGVTLAIGFGNWNSERVQKNQEHQLILDLKSDLESNVAYLQLMRDSNSRAADRIGSVLSYLEDRKPRSAEFDSLVINLEGWSSPYLQRGTYETLKSRGINLISDDELRTSVVQLYEGRYNALINDSDRAAWIHYETSTLPQIQKHFERHPNRASRVVDYQALVNDQSFRNAFLYSKNFVFLLLNGRTVESLEETHRSLDLIEQYLSKHAT